MKPPVERIRVSQRSRDILVTLKRRTGIEHWNVLCRWALLDSLSNPNKPSPPTPSSDSNVEMTWDQFAGELSEALLAAFLLRAAQDGVPLNRSELGRSFRSHLERGILQLQSAAGLAELCARVKRAAGVP